MTTRRKLVSTSLAANTAMRVALPAGNFSGDQVTVAFWWRVPVSTSGNSLNTLWASQTGEYQIYCYKNGYNHTLLGRIDGSNPTVNVAAPAPGGDWVFVVFNGGLDHAATRDAILTISDGITTNDGYETTSAASGDDLTAAHTQYILGDDNNGAASDDGFIGEVFDFCVFDGIVDAADLQHDGSGSWQDLSAAAQAALVYRYDGQNASDPGEDSSGNGNDATVENGGVTLSDSDLPSGANPVSSGATGTMAAGEAGGDAFAASGSVAISGAISAQEAGTDAASMSGSVAISGALAATEAGSDTASMSGSVIWPGVTGALAATEAGSDAFAGAGSVAWPDLTGTMSASETGTDVSSIEGFVSITGLLAATEAGGDTASFAGLVTEPGRIGALAAQEAGQDVASISGSVSVTGNLVAQETFADAFSGAGSVQGASTGTLAAQESGQDTAIITGAVEISGVLSAIETGADTFLGYTSTPEIRAETTGAATQSHILAGSLNRATLAGSINKGSYYG